VGVEEGFAVGTAVGSFSQVHEPSLEKNPGEHAIQVEAAVAPTVADFVLAGQDKQINPSVMYVPHGQGATVGSAVGEAVGAV